MGWERYLNALCKQPLPHHLIHTGQQKQSTGAQRTKQCLLHVVVDAENGSDIPQVVFERFGDKAAREGMRLPNRLDTLPSLQTKHSLFSFPALEIIVKVTVQENL